MILLYERWAIPWGHMGAPNMADGGDPPAAADSAQYVRKAWTTRGKWRVRKPRVKDNLIVEQGNSIEDL